MPHTTMPYAFIEDQLLTRAAPTLATEGQALKPFRAGGSIAVVVEANAGQTLLGTGSLDCWVFDDVINGWSRLKAVGIDLPLSLAGARRQAFPAVTLGAPRNARAIWTATGIGVSGGTTVRVYQLGYSPFYGANY